MSICGAWLRSIPCTTQSKPYQGWHCFVPDKITSPLVILGCPVQVYPQKKGSTETYQVPFSRVVYIERTDFREHDSKDFYGMAPGKSVMLRWVQIGRAHV